ncbi:MAG: hypothetical protein OXN90_18885 [Gemmatimonadota bacterium]|nr:hypothetical protein [Gemmatimonadota bacterium]
MSELTVLNERLAARCLELLGTPDEGNKAASLLADLDALRALPVAPFEACEHVPGQVSSTALVRKRLVDYSGPAIHAHKKATVQGRYIITPLLTLPMIEFCPIGQKQKDGEGERSG